MTQLNQIIAIEKGVRQGAERTFTNAYHTIQKDGPLDGLSRSYTPKDEDGDRFPDENKLVQVKVEDLMVEVANSLTRLFDVTLTKEEANRRAGAHVVLKDGTALLTDVPVGYLLFLERQLVHVRTFVSKLPTLDPAQTWQRDPATDTWVTDPVGTSRTQKVLRNHKVAAATDKHPEQVQVYTEDVPVGTWTTRKFSGAVPAKRKQKLLDRVDELTEAVKKAREEANMLTVTDRRAGDDVFGFLFE